VNHATLGHRSPEGFGWACPPRRCGVQQVFSLHLSYTESLTGGRRELSACPGQRATACHESRDPETQPAHSSGAGGVLTEGGLGSPAGLPISEPVQPITGAAIQIQLFQANPGWECACLMHHRDCPFVLPAGYTPHREDVNLSVAQR